MLAGSRALAPCILCLKAGGRVTDAPPAPLHRRGGTAASLREAAGGSPLREAKLLSLRELGALRRWLQRPANGMADIAAAVQAQGHWPA